MKTVICTEKERNTLLELFPCKENNDFSYFAQCKKRNKYNSKSGELLSDLIFNSCFDCITYHNNIKWEIIQ